MKDDPLEGPCYFVGHKTAQMLPLDPNLKPGVFSPHTTQWLHVQHGVQLGCTNQLSIPKSYFL
jgi:hypothetical protein